MLFEKLPERDVRLIESYIDEYGPNPGSSVYYGHRAPTKDILCFWDEAKSDYLYQLFGGKFILEKNISYTVPLSKLSEQLSKACHQGEMNDFYMAYYTKMNKMFPDFWSNAYTGWSALCSTINLAKNSLENAFYEDSIVLEFEDGNKVKLEKTTKPLRALGKIAKLIDEEESFEKFRLEHSRILNQKKLEGTLCLSIHPMDYMTMSDNASRWNSCMKWVDAGSYRMGTVEMMNSSCVIVGYLKSNNSTWFDWNDKHWRTLLIADESILTTIKSYPYACDELSQMLIDWVRELAENNLSWSFGPTTEIFEGESFLYSGDNNWYHFTANSHQMYNDFGCATHWGAMPIHIADSSSREDPYCFSINYSGPAECMYCGREVDLGGGGNYDESYVFCGDCCSDANDDETECSECGNWWSHDDMFYVEGDYVCPDCIDDVAACAIGSWEYYYYDNLERIYLTKSIDNPDEDTNLCCFFPSSRLSRFAGAFYNLSEYCYISAPRMTENGILYFNREDLTQEGLSNWFHLYPWNINEYFKGE